MVLEEAAEFGMLLGIPDEFPYEFSLDSPEESVLGSSTETESDEDELTHQLTRLNLHGPSPFPSSFFKPGCDRFLPSSPKSTLSRPRDWGSPVAAKASKVAPFSKDHDIFDGFFGYTAACAGDEAGVKMKSGGPPEANYYHNRGLLHQPHGTGQVRVHLHKATCPGFHPLQPEQLVNHQAKQASRWAENAPTRGSYVRPLGTFLRPATPTLKSDQCNKIGNNCMRAVFLGGAGAERAGTGVFLPRRYDNNNNNNNNKNNNNRHIAANPPRKTNCPAVLIPARVMHSLNLNFEEISVHPQAHPFYNHNAAFAPTYDALMARRHAILAQQKRTLKVEGGAKQDIDLPQDWTY